MRMTSTPPRSAGASRRRTGDPDDGPGGGDPLVPLTPGMAMVQEAVRFTNAEVLDPTRYLGGAILPIGMSVGANTLAEQAGAMMIEDVRGFLQSMEMIMVPVAAKALSESLQNNPAGEATIAQLQVLMTELTTFAGAVIGEAALTKGALT